MIKGNFLTPEYYARFKCKCGDCRNCCCSGWNITLTMSDYAHLMNLNCSDELKERIKNGVSIFPDATKDRYAKIDMSYYGECKLRLENGWCGLQCEVGEDNIPSVCRNYPRGIRQYPSLECSISNSCEWVIEELVKSTDKLKFTYNELNINLDNDEDIKVYPKDYDLKREKVIEIFTNREKNILDRLNDLSKYLEVDNSFINNDFIQSMIDRLNEVYHHSYSIGDYIKNEEFNLMDSYKLCMEKIDNFEINVEKIFVNHIFFMRYPYIRSDLNMEYSYMGLFFTFVFYLSILKNNLDKNYVDLTACFFRTAEHANMYDIIYNNVKRLK